ncbi:Hypothetical protein PHPALM_13758, partial [Phytophthora palmivora]
MWRVKHCGTVQRYQVRKRHQQHRNQQRAGIRVSRVRHLATEHRHAHCTVEIPEERVDQQRPIDLQNSMHAMLVYFSTIWQLSDNVSATNLAHSTPVVSTNHSPEKEDSKRNHNEDGHHRHSTAHDTDTQQ